MREFLFMPKLSRFDAYIGTPLVAGGVIIGLRTDWPLLAWVGFAVTVFVVAGFSTWMERR